MITASTILPAIIHGATVVLYLAVRRRLERRKGAFDLGHLELPVAIGALAWSVVTLVVLVTVGAAFLPTLIVGGLLPAGGLFLAGLLTFNRGRSSPWPARLASRRSPRNSLGQVTGAGMWQASWPGTVCEVNAGERRGHGRG